MDQIRQKFEKWNIHKKTKQRDDLFREIWQIYHGKLQVYVSQFSNNSDDRTDLASEILLKVFESIDRYNSSYSFSTWLYTIARNYQVDLIRKKKIQYEDLDDNSVSHEQTPEAILIRDSDQQLIKEAVTLLSSLDKEIIFLYFYEELKYREISDITGIPEGTIKYRMSENRKFLKKKLERSLIR